MDGPIIMGFIRVSPNSPPGSNSSFLHDEHLNSCEFRDDSNGSGETLQTRTVNNDKSFMSLLGNLDYDNVNMSLFLHWFCLTGLNEENKRCVHPQVKHTDV